MTFDYAECAASPSSSNYIYWVFQNYNYLVFGKIYYSLSGSDSFWYSSYFRGNYNSFDVSYGSIPTYRYSYGSNYILWMKIGYFSDSTTYYFNLQCSGQNLYHSKRSAKTTDIDFGQAACVSSGNFCIKT